MSLWPKELHRRGRASSFSVTGVQISILLVYMDVLKCLSVKHVAYRLNMKGAFPLYSDSSLLIAIPTIISCKSVDILAERLKVVRSNIKLHGKICTLAMNAISTCFNYIQLQTSRFNYVQRKLKLKSLPCLQRPHLTVRSSM